LGLYSAYIAFLFLRLTDAVLTLLFFPFFSNYIKTPYTIRIWYKKHARIWRYGDVEFHFDHWVVWLIFSDHDNLIDGGSSLQINPWIIRRGMLCAELANGLDHEGVKFTITQPQYDSSQRLLQTEAGVVFTFIAQSEETGQESGLVTWSMDAKHFSQPH
ncbi:MAG: hypothetical protein F6J87_31435, partial [Spirulina sp. SIO3F2]|nr:hypothetical protein [Spirulina sp. SIO3F2]